MPVDDRGGHVDELAVRRARLVTEQLKSCPLVHRVALHQDSFRPLDVSPPPEGAFEFVVLSEAAQHDVDRALPVRRVGIRYVGEDATFRGFSDEVCVRGMEKDDHRAGGLVHDLLDQVESVLRAFAETDEGYVRPFPRRHSSDVLDVDLAGDHFVPERGNDGCDERQRSLRSFAINTRRCSVSR
jgi:hypothetical protein